MNEEDYKDEVRIIEFCKAITPAVIEAAKSNDGSVDLPFMISGLGEMFKLMVEYITPNNPEGRKKIFDVFAKRFCAV